jgi:hypothetical protein
LTGAGAKRLNLTFVMTATKFALRSHKILESGDKEEPLLLEHETPEK